MIISLTIPGIPIAKKRPRFFRRGKFVGTYNAQETEEGRFMFELHRLFNETPLEGPLKLKLVFAMPIPKSLSKAKIKEILAGTLRHTKKPDLDNLVKFVKDCCNGVIWKDDSQVFELKARKEYSDIAKTFIEIEEV